MRVPLSWLAEFVDLDRSPDGPESLARLLTSAGLEVGAIERFGVDGAELVWDRERVLLARVLRVEPHPNADRLVLATVDYGAAEPKVVVTGAPNLFPLLDASDLGERSLWSPLILEGASYFDAHQDGKVAPLRGKKLRGVYNDAMLCSLVELGLSEDHDGIVLIDAADSVGAAGDDAGYRPGIPLQDVLGDVVLEIDIIPNIARCASILGVAREVAALTGSELRLPDTEVTMAGRPLAGRLVIETEAPELNPRFVALLIEGVDQRPSPFWMQHRLRLAGQRPIHVVVDVSNYVMLEIGQPNHAFDWDFLRRRADRYDPGGPVRIRTRLARTGETLTTLDGAERALHPNNILVTDPAGSLSVGGIMGGRDSEIEPETRSVLLEAAAWDFINIRHSSRQLGLQSEAGFRFSRGVHPSQALLGAKRAAELLRRYAGGTVAEGVVDFYPRPAPVVTVALEPSAVVRLTGLELGRDEIAGLLARAGFEIGGAAAGPLEVTVPDHRMDIEGPHDLIEEVCRMYGYDRVPSTVLRDVLPPQRGNPVHEREERIKDLLVEQGFREVITYRLTTPESEARLLGSGGDPARYWTLTNPSTAERVALRHRVLASVLEVAAANRRFRDDLRLFEIGPVFEAGASGVGAGEGADELPRELARLALVLSGRRAGDHWHGSPSERLDYFDLKGAMESLFDALRIEIRFEAATHTGFRPGRTARLLLVDGGVELGVLGELHPTVAEAYDLLRAGVDQPILAAEIDLDALPLAAGFAVTPIALFPAIREDIALVVDAVTPASAVADALLAAGSPLLTQVELFDLYAGDQVGAGKKSLAYHLTFQSREKTLEDREVSKLRQRVVADLGQRLGAVLRE